MSKRMTVAVSVAALASLLAPGVGAADFDWKKHQGKTVSFLANNNPWSQAVLAYKDEFEKNTTCAALARNL
jgi:multiple sugar transport system substrate-binding protein